MSQSEQPDKGPVPESTETLNEEELRTIEDELFDLEERLVDIQGSIMRSHADDDQGADPRQFIQQYAFRSPDSTLNDSPAETTSPYQQLEKILSNLKGLQEVRPGQLLAVDVTEGESIYSGGACTIASHDNSRIYAGRLGQIVWTDRTVHVLPIKRVEDNLGSSSSAIRYDGSVLVEGNVEDGADIEATGNIWIGGSVGRADLQASGDIVIGQGIKGDPEHSIKAFGSVYCRFIENARIEAGSDVVAESAILRSIVQARDRVLVVGEDSVIAGGRVQAGQLVHAFSIGSQSVSSTQVIIQSPAQQEIDQEQLDQQLTDLNEQERVYEQNIQKLRDKNSGKGLAPDEEEELREMQYELNQLREKREEVVARLNRADQDENDQRISAEQRVYPDTRLVIGGAERITEVEHGRVLFRPDNKRVVIQNYRHPEITLNVSTEVDQGAIEQNSEYDLPDRRELRRHLVFESNETLYERDRQFRRLMELEPDDDLIVLSRASPTCEHCWWAIEVRPDEDPDEIRQYFKGETKDSVKVWCTEPKEGAKRAADYLQTDTDNVAIKILEEGQVDLFGFGKDPYLLKVVKRDALKRRQEDPSLRDGLVEIERTDDRPGHFRLINDDDGLKLIVSPAEGEGMPVTVEQVEHELEKQDYKNNIDYEAVKKTVRKAEGQPVRIAPRQREPRIDGDFDVTISDNRAKAFLTVEPPEEHGQPVNPEEVISYLDNEGIEFNRENVMEVFEREQFNQSVCIAEGREPVDGEDAVVTIMTPMSDQAVEEYRRVTECEVRVEAENKQSFDDSVDHYSGQDIASVKKGANLMRIKPATDGKPGRTVYGEPLSCETGERADVQPGKNVEKKSNRLYATHEGRAVFDGTTLHVEPIFYVEGDLGYETGNIDFNGVVVVQGRIQDGFRVEATRRVEAQSAGKAEIVSGGDVMLQQGIAGRDEGCIEARGSVFVKYAENARIQAGEDVVVQEALLHSDVGADDNVIVKTEGRSSIVGGCTRAGSIVWSEAIGTGMGPETQIEVGIKPGLRRRISELETELDQYQDKLEKIKTQLRGIKKRMPREGPQKLSDEKREHYQKTTQAARALKEKISNLHSELNSVREQYQSRSRGAIYVRGRVHAGVRLTIRSQTLQVTKTQQSCYYHLGGDEETFTSEAYHEPDVNINYPDTILAPPST